MVLRQAATMIVAGLIAGVGVTLLAAELLSKLLYGVAARDVVSFTLAPLVIALVAVIACVGPARRAARVDPVRALRIR